MHKPLMKQNYTAVIRHFARSESERVCALLWLTLAIHIGKVDREER